MFNQRSSLTRKPHAKALYLFFIAVLLTVALGASPAKAVSPGRWREMPNQGLFNYRHSWVHSLAVSGSDLYVGGSFTQTRDGTLMNLNNIAHYDAITDTWHALPNPGFDSGGVMALAVSGSDLYVSGRFITNLSKIARYDTIANTWHDMPNQGVGGQVLALAVSGSDLYVGGSFTQTRDGTLMNLGNIARYDTAAGTWHALSNKGLDEYNTFNFVSALAVSGDNLYVAGEFNQTGDGSLTDLGNVARYNTNIETWHALPNKGLNDEVWALAASGDDLYAGGYFTQTVDGALTNLGYIAHYNAMADTWHSLPNQGLGDSGYPYSGVHALTVSNGDLYVGGNFYQTGDGSLTDLGYIALYDTIAGAWHALSNKGLNGDVYALAVSGNGLYVGGGFGGTGDGSLPTSGCIARYTPVVNVYLPLLVR